MSEDQQSVEISTPEAFAWWAKQGCSIDAYLMADLDMSAYRWKTLTQIVSIVGTFGISFLFSLFAAVTGEGLILLKTFPKKRFPEYKFTAIFCVTLFAISTIYGAFAYNKTRNPIKTFDAVSVRISVKHHFHQNHVYLQQSF